jgi:hypothetical protein
VNWLSPLVSFFVGLLGREAWEWLPGLARVILQVETSVLSAERRHVRRAEWNAELRGFEQRRLAAVLWALSLAPVCAWEAITESRMLSTLAKVLDFAIAVPLMLAAYCFPILYPMGAVIAAINPLGFSVIETAGFVVFSPLILSVVLTPFLCAREILWDIVVRLWESRAVREGEAM